MNTKTTIFHLNYDMLNAIMLLVVASAGGAKELAKAMAVCKGFAKFGDDKNLLTMASFEDFDLPNSVEHCHHHIRSLLVRCAEAGNSGAQYKLAQVILFQFSQLDQKSYCNKGQLACSNTLPPFLRYFMPEQAMISYLDGKRFTHFELVSLFLSHCSLLDHVFMLPHVQNYVELFRNVTKDCTLFYHWYNNMTRILRAIVFVGRDRRQLHSPRLVVTYCPIMPLERNAGYVMQKLEESFYFYFFNNFIVQPPLNWEELKRESHFIAKELLYMECDAKPLEENAKILDIGKRFFYYLAISGPVTRELDLALNRDGDNLRAACIHYAKVYNIYQQEAVFCFDEMWVPLGQN